MTTALSADDVRRLVMEPLDDTTGYAGELPAPKPALFTRCSGCQPPSLYFSDEHWWATDDDGFRDIRADSIAVDLILMSIARDATAARESMKYGSELHYQAGWCLQNLTTAIMFSKLEDAVKWRHQLKDLEDST